MSAVGVILSTVGDAQYLEGYHDACGRMSLVPWRGEVFSTGGLFCYLSIPWYS